MNICHSGEIYPKNTEATGESIELLNESKL